MNLFLSPSILSGTLSIPPSKSISHRMLICAGLAKGLSTISNIELSQDILATINCLKALGARISLSNSICQVQGAALPFKKATLDAGESGSTLRFLLPVAALSKEKMTFLGKPGLLSRPMGVYADLFLSQNLLFEQSASKIVIQGPLQPGVFSLPGEISSQFVSGLLFATPLMPEESEIAVLPPYNSKSYVNLTLSALKTFGIEVERLSGHGYQISGNQSYKAQKVAIEGDYSSLSPFAVYAALANPLSFSNLKEESEQGDQILLSILQEAGAEIDWSSNTNDKNKDNNRQILTISPKAIKPITADLADCPDLAPALFVLASFIEGENVFLHTKRLAYKESNRIESMKAELEKFGVKMIAEDDQVIITGKAHYDPASVQKEPKKEQDNPDSSHIAYDNRFADLFDTSATLDNPDYSWLSSKENKNEEVIQIESHNDHRIAMAMAIFALINQSPIEIENAQVVSKSYPDFFEDLKELGADLHES